MDAISEFFTWLFSSRQGVICLLVGGIVLCLVIALVLERRGRRRYFDHEDEGEGGGLFSSLFGDDEDE